MIPMLYSYKILDKHLKAVEVKYKALKYSFKNGWEF